MSSPRFTCREHQIFPSCLVAAPVWRGDYVHVRLYQDPRAGFIASSPLPAGLGMITPRSDPRSWLYIGPQRPPCEKFSSPAYLRRRL
jgi:hypothetical protein